MREKTNQDSVDERIHKFMARKSPVRILSKTIADQFIHDTKMFVTTSGIDFERTRWHLRHKVRHK